MVQPGQDVLGAVVTLSNLESALTGSVSAPDGRDLSDLAVIVFPMETGLRSIGSWRIRGPVGLDALGRFSLLGLPEGEYWAVLVPNVAGSQPSGLGYFGALDGYGLKIALNPGERVQVSLVVK